MGFFRTPNGSFWDQDDEYFNKEGFDINGGYYIKEIEYIPGPNWLDDLGCYEKDKEKYMNLDLDKLDDENFYEEENINEDGKYEEDIFKGDFEGEDDYFNDEDFKKYVKDGEFENAIKGLNLDNLKLDNLNINKELSNVDILNSIMNGNGNGNGNGENMFDGATALASSKKKKNKNRNKKNKNKNKKVDDDDEWKTSSD